MAIRVMNISPNKSIIASNQYYQYINEDHKPPTSLLIASTTGTLLTTSAYMVYLAKSKRGSNFLNRLSKIELGIKEGILLCTFATLGGLIPGIMFDKKDNSRAKVQEAMHQIIGNGVIPFSCLALVNKCTKKFNKVIRSILAIGTLCASTYLGHFLVDKTTGTKDVYKIGIADFAPDIDDWVLATSTIIKSPSLYKFTACVCPFTYSIYGIKTGIKQKKYNKELDLKV